MQKWTSNELSQLTMWYLFCRFCFVLVFVVVVVFFFFFFFFFFFVFFFFFFFCVAVIEEIRDGP